MSLLKTYILDVGHGDSIILELPTQDGAKKVGIIDCFDFDKTWNILDNQINPKIVQFVVATHPHHDHIKGLQALLEKCASEEIEIEMFWDSGYEHDSLTYQQLSDYLKDHDEIITWYPRTGLSVLFGDVEIHVLAPPDPLITNTPSDCNNASLVLLVKYKLSRLLFAGDAQFSNWAQSCVNQYPWMGAQVLKVSHHGSKHGTFLEALEAINPKYAIISGEESYKQPNGVFPHKLTLEALNELGTNIYCTHDHGDITIETQGNRTHTLSTSQPWP